MFIYVESECRGYTPGSCGALLASLVFVRDELKGREMEMCRQASERVAQHGGSAPDPGKSHGHVMTLKGVWPGRVWGRQDCSLAEASHQFRGKNSSTFNIS